MTSLENTFYDRVTSFQGGTFKFHLKQWEELTSDPEILTTEMTVSLAPAKKQKILSFCVKLLVTEQAPLSQVAQLLGTFSSSFIAVPYSKLYRRSLERSKTKSLVIFKGNFDKIMYVSKEAI